MWLNKFLSHSWSTSHRKQLICELWSLKKSSIPQGKSSTALGFGPLALDVVRRGVQLAGGEPSLFCHPLLRLLSLSKAAGTQCTWGWRGRACPAGEKTPWRCAMCPLVLHTAMVRNTPSLAQPHILPQSPREEEHTSPPTRQLVSYKAQSQMPRHCSGLFI